MKQPISYIDLRIFPDTAHWGNQCARATVVRLPRHAFGEEIKREYDYLTQSSFNRIVRCQQHFMQWQAFNKWLHAICHISR